MAAAFAPRILRSQLFGVTPVDPLTSDSGASSGVACRANSFPLKRVYNFLIGY